MTVAELQAQLAAFVAEDPTVGELEVAMATWSENGPNFAQGVSLSVDDPEDPDPLREDGTVPERYVEIF